MLMAESLARYILCSAENLPKVWFAPIDLNVEIFVLEESQVFTKQAHTVCSISQCHSASIVEMLLSALARNIIMRRVRTN